MLHEWPGPRTHGQTVSRVVEPDVADAVRELPSRGIELDVRTPRLRTIAVATIGDRHYAWFHDPDDNVIGIRD